MSLAATVYRYKERKCALMTPCAPARPSRTVTWYRIQRPLVSELYVPEAPLVLPRSAKIEAPNSSQLGVGLHSFGGYLNLVDHRNRTESWYPQAAALTFFSSWPCLSKAFKETISSGSFVSCVPFLWFSTWSSSFAAGFYRPQFRRLSGLRFLLRPHPEFQLCPSMTQ